MNVQERELTSALLDGELDHAAQSRVATSLLQAGDEALERFGRYRLIGDVMRGESAVIANRVSARVQAALRDEPVILAPQTPNRARWLRPAAGMAVAASVAVAAVMLAPTLLNPVNDAGSAPAVADNLVGAGMMPTVAPTLVSASSASVGDNGETPRALGSDSLANAHWQGINPDVEDRLNRLLIEHNEFSGRTGVNGPVPHIGFVSFESR